MAKRITLTARQEKEYNKLKANFKITKREYLDYYKNVRKANQKLARLERENTILTERRKFSTKLSMRLKTRDDFLRIRKGINVVLERKYRRKINTEARERFKRNLTRALIGATDTEIKEAMDLIDSLSDKELGKFLNENKHLHNWFYDSLDEKKILRMWELMDMSREKIINVLTAYKKKR